MNEKLREAIAQGKLISIYYGIQWEEVYAANLSDDGEWLSYSTGRKMSVVIPVANVTAFGITRATVTTGR